MTEPLLRSLRERALDESETLAGLLRKCLLLGAETGSSSLRDWARHELNGYTDEALLPEYRKIPNVPMVMDSMSGNTWMTGQTVTRSQLPAAARQYVSEVLFLTQPVEEFERLAREKALHFKPGGLAAAQAKWNQEIGPFQSIVNLSYVMSGSVFTGILGQIRTKLVDFIADLTVTTPLTELPSRADVEAAMLQRIGHVGDVYTTTILEPSGPTAIGAGASSSAGLSIDDVVELLATVQRSAHSTDADTSEIETAIEELREAITKSQPETGEVIKRAGKLRALADKLGVAAVTSASSAAVSALMDLAMQGAFG
ncbi:AbiTii domain-containing protein [Arthrobacter sp. D2-10]